MNLDFVLDPSFGVRQINIFDNYVVLWVVCIRSAKNRIRSAKPIYPFPGECWVETDEGWVAVILKEAGK